MAPIAMVFGVLLTLLGPILFFASTPEPPAETVSPTALIPSGFGLALIILGVVARNEKARMHAMHGAALLGLIGFVVPTFMVSRALIGGATFHPLRHGGQIAMAVLCLVFVALCVKSFIDARIVRKQKEAEGTPPAPQ